MLVLGSGGMLGHKFAQVLNQRWETWGTVTGSPELVAHFSNIPTNRILADFDAADGEQLAAALDKVKPTWVVNAIGLIKQSPLIENVGLASELNVALPQRLANICVARDIRLFHLSTDCVFAGDKGMPYTDDDAPDADDDYGRTKAAGERVADSALVIRTSTIGRELNHFHGLMEWFLSQPPGSVPGYTHAIWSGFPSVTLASLVADIMESHPDLRGLFNLASEPISKYRLLQWLGEAFGGHWKIDPVDAPTLDRSLDGSRLQARTGIAIPPWPLMLEELQLDSFRHDELRKSL